MKHSIKISGPAFTLRPVENRDINFMIQLRSDPELNRFLHKISGSFDDQLKWLQIYFAKMNDFYFVIESQKYRTPEGLISIYNVDETQKKQSGVDGGQTLFSHLWRVHILFISVP